jgi:ribose/xylose/arabinose/galactoside ABC-type transport system permease subunit
MKIVLYFLSFYPYYGLHVNAMGGREEATNVVGLAYDVVNGP